MINLRDWLNTRLERQTHAEMSEASEVAARVELLALRRAMRIRLHMDELQAGTLACIDNVVSLAAARTGRM
jgi:hypothetical protein